MGIKKESYQEEDINLKEILFKYLIYWKWFLLSIVICLCLAIVYLKIKPRVYQSEAKILLVTDKDNTASLPGLKELAAITDMTGNKIEDQIELLKSRRLMIKVVEKLNFNVRYLKTDLFIKKQVYKEAASVNLFFLNDKQKYLVNKEICLQVIIKSDKQFKYKNLKTGEEGKAIFNRPIKLYFGEVVISKNIGSKVGDETIIEIQPIMQTVLGYLGAIDVKATSKNGNVVSLKLKSTLPEEANKVIDSLILQYNEDAIQDRKEIGENTISFINDRLALISKDLGVTDQDMEHYKSSKRITDLFTEGEQVVKQASRIEEQLKDYTIQLNLIDYLQQFINNNNKKLIPTNIGFKDESILATTQKYNELVLERDHLLKSSTEENPIIKNLDKRIIEFNNNLKNSLINYKRITQIAIGSLKKQSEQVSDNISQIPSKERGFRDIYRRQQTIEALYLLLLQKREETEVTTASTPNVVKIVDQAYYSMIPVSPKKKLILLIGLFLGIAIPFAILYIKYLLDNKVKSKKDIENIVKNIDFIGSIPKSEENIVNISSANSFSAEAFRILRTNINFLLSSRKNLNKCIYVTSTIGGEGKTFIAINLAFTLALTQKKVLVLEADIRKPKLRKYLGIFSNPEGVTEYLSDNTSLDIHQMIIPIKYPDSSSVKIDILPSGRIAPNPSELLMNGKFKDIVEYGYNNYDYIIVDTAPVSLVTDTLLINDYADLLLYVVRAGHLYKNLLEVPLQLKQEGKFQNHKTAILINDVDMKKGYGYSYSYSYGYSEEKIPWYKKFL